VAKTIPEKIELKNYKPAPYVVDSVFLDIRLDARETRVTSRLSLRPNPASAVVEAPLVLDGKMISLKNVSLNGSVVDPSMMSVSDDMLVISSVPQQSFELEVTTTCNPSINTTLSGLYMSSGIFCTQCEAEGFRRITYFPDRPDVMARYTTRIEADLATCPLLLSNGNPKEKGEIAGTGRHYAIWDDPFPKPSYLFALVAGDLDSVRDTFTTMKGRTVELGIHVERGKADRCDWAMESLKTSMRWDEQRFGLEYDLDVFNIVAVPDFNMGAMENKGLNIFNDKYILALPGTATDQDFVNIESIIAHEYFHNWTGNRVTCRDWFQLCLKEGLTVFRDQEFTSDIRSRAVKRINDVKTLRARQFPEDGGPLAHPVRPDSYIEINNFYTPTVYEKGAEICRMLEALIGREAFRKGMDLYFLRHDGEAATVEDFISCMAEASGANLQQFFRWYEQAGTPHLVVEGHHDHTTKTYTLTVEQRTPPTAGEPQKLPLHIPLGIGLVGPNGEDSPLDLDGTGLLNAPLIELREQKKVFRFRNVAKRPVLSLNRGFSAPIHITSNSTAADQLFLMGHDGDSYNRWEASQTRGRALIIANLEGAPQEEDLDGYAKALKLMLGSSELDDAYKALMLGFPTESEIAAAIGRDVDTDAVFGARNSMRSDIGRRLSTQLNLIWAQTMERGPYRPDPEGTARRSLRYAVLQLIMMANREAGIERALADLDTSHSMTAEVGSLTALVQVDCPERQQALDVFHAQHRNDHLLIDKWLMLNAQCPGSDAAKRIDALTRHPDFKWTTPNKVYALFAAFTSGNSTGFNAADGSGYRLVADAVLTLNAINPQVAARIATGFRSCRVLSADRRAAAQRELERILAHSALSRDVFEIASRIAEG